VASEAGPTGYGVHRQLTSLGFECMVVAPSLIPKRPGDKIKTDRRDALKLARLLRSGDLTSVWVPDEAHEALRNLVRARADAKVDQLRAKHRLSKFLLRQGCYPPVGMKNWSQRYFQWLRQLQFEHLPDRVVFGWSVNTCTLDELTSTTAESAALRDSGDEPRRGRRMASALSSAWSTVSAQPSPDCGSERFLCKPNSERREIRPETELVQPNCPRTSAGPVNRADRRTPAQPVSSIDKRQQDHGASPPYAPGDSGLELRPSH
jgi:hypothetical protein